VKGRKPKPREQRIAEGNPGRRPIPDAIVIGTEIERVNEAGEFIDPLTVAPYPTHLPADGLTLWERIVPALADLGVMRDVFMPGLELMCQEWAIIERSNRVLAEFGDYSRGGGGQIIRHPAHDLRFAASAELRRLMEQYGLTPSALARMGLTIAQGKALGQELDDTLGKR